MNTLGFFPIHLFLDEDGCIPNNVECWALVEALRSKFMASVPPVPRPV
jgi:hypothetical protein